MNGVVVMKVRSASTQDFEVCREFDFKHIRDQWLRQSIENGWVYFAELDGNIVGYLRLEFIWFVKPYIGWITVQEEHRRKGFGSQLILHIARELAQQGYDAFYTSTESLASENLAFYRKLGFEECGIVTQINENGNGEIFLVKPLK